MDVDDLTAWVLFFETEQFNFIVDSFEWESQHPTFHEEQSKFQPYCLVTIDENVAENTCQNERDSNYICPNQVEVEHLLVAV